MAKQNIQKIQAWKTENVDRIVVQPRKTRMIPARLQAAVDAGLASSRQEYILRAVEDALQRDGFVVEDE